MHKTIPIPTHLTADQFGITDVEYFVNHIRGKRLPVVSETKGYLTVQDQFEQQWTVHKGDLQTKVGSNG